MTEETKAYMEANAAMPADFTRHAYEHFAKAVRKHPRFADALFSEDAADDAKGALEQARREIGYLAAHNWLDGDSLTQCEIAEAQFAYTQGDKATCVDELYDAVAVLMRMIAVVEGRQKLGGAE